MGNPEIQEIFLLRGISDLHSDGISVTYKSFNRPFFSLIDDDFTPSYVVSIKNLCDELGIKADFAVLPIEYQDSVYIPDSRQSLLPEFESDGHSFMLHPEHSHWYNDATHTFIDVATVEKSLKDCIRSFKFCGIGDYADIIVYPGGSNFQGVREMCTKYVSYGISTGGDYNYDLSSPYSINRMGITFKQRGVAEMKSLIDYGVEHNAWMIFCTHSWLYTDESSFGNNVQSILNLKNVLEYAKSKADFLPVRDVLSRFYYVD